MTLVAEWIENALVGSTLMMVAVLAVRGPARHWLGPRLAYTLWALPVMRLVTPPLSAPLFATLPRTVGGGRLQVLFTGGRGVVPWHGGAMGGAIGSVLITAWLAGAVVFLAWQIVRHFRYRQRLLDAATSATEQDAIRVVTTAVDGPVALGVFGRMIAVPYDFASRYDASERRLVLAHEIAHHARGDLIANWLSLIVLAAHWWNPVAWAAIGAFRDDQEFAVDAHVLAHCALAERPAYARVLARAAGLGHLPACNLTRKSSLKGRLMMLSSPPVSRRRLILGGGGLGVAAAVALVATLPVAGSAAPSAGRQAVTIAVKPDGSGGYALIVGGEAAAPGAPLAGGVVLPADFSPHGGCDLEPAATPRAMVIKGSGGVEAYTVICASAAPAAVRATLVEGLASLKSMRGSIATQPASPAFPESERRYALAKVDRSIREVETTLAKAG